MVARQITYHAARQKDSGRRCDLEAGMAKLLAARVAWAAADNAVQIHGGNGFALEYPVSRVLCDARILNIFEGNQDSFEEFAAWDWTADHAGSRFSHLVYGVADEAGLARVLSLSAARGAAHVFVTSGAMPHPWGALPPYWPAEVASIRRSRGAES